jgi:hypothetical protein
MINCFTGDKGNQILYATTQAYAEVIAACRPRAHAAATKKAGLPETSDNPATAINKVH